MRRRRRNRATWFPVIPTSFEGQSIQFSFYEDQFLIAGSPGDRGDWNGEPVFIQPLTWDSTTQTSATEPGTSLRDIVQGQDWMCERVVGKVWGAFSQSPEAQADRIILGAALAVLPVNDDSSMALTPDEYDPLGADNAQQPWLWRRTWTLYRNDLGTGPNMLTGPTNIGNVGAGTFDGGHVDTKGVKRRIRRDQRLFIVASCVTLAGETAGDPALVTFGYDLRLVGGMRTSRNQSTFK